MKKDSWERLEAKSFKGYFIDSSYKYVLSSKTGKFKKNNQATRVCIGRRGNLSFLIKSTKLPTHIYGLSVVLDKLITMARNSQIC